MHQIAPLPIAELEEKLCGYSTIVIVEESARDAAIHDSLAFHLRKLPGVRQILCRDLGNAYIPHGDMASLYKYCGLDGQSIADLIVEVGQNEN